MEIYKILSGLMQERQLKIAEVARICDLPDSTVRSIVQRKQKRVGLDVAIKLSDGLGITLEHLQGGDHELDESPENALSDREQEMIRKFRALSPENQTKLHELLQLYLGSQEDFQ